MVSMVNIPLGMARILQVLAAAFAITSLCLYLTSSSHKVAYACLILRIILPDIIGTATPYIYYVPLP